MPAGAQAQPLRNPRQRQRRLRAQLPGQFRLAALPVYAPFTTLIASRGMLSGLAHDWDKHAGELMQWQRELLK